MGFKFLPTVNVDGFFTAKVKGAVTDKDVGKAFKLSVDTTDTYEVCADGNPIDAFLVGIEAATADGLKLATLNKMGLVECQASGAANIGGLVVSGAVAALGTAETNGLPLVKAAPALGDAATGAQITAALGTRWRIVSGTTANGVIANGDTTLVIERV